MLAVGGGGTGPGAWPRGILPATTRPGQPQAACGPDPLQPRDCAVLPMLAATHNTATPASSSSCSMWMPATSVALCSMSSCAGMNQLGEVSTALSMLCSGMPWQTAQEEHCHICRCEHALSGNWLRAQHHDLGCCRSV